MTDSFTFHTGVVADGPWLAAPATPLGAVPSGRGTPDLYVFVTRDGKPFRRLDLYGDETSELYVQQKIIGFGELLGIGFGHHIFLVRVLGGESRTLQLSSYFLDFHRIGDSVYVVSGGDITRLNLQGEVLWTSPPIAIDGVEIDSTSADFISGRGDYDPPGGWQPFRIRTSDGRLVD